MLGCLEQTVPRPLPGLRPVPTQLAQHPGWGRYFDRRAELLRRDAELCRDDAAAWTGESAPAWAAPFVERDVVGELAVWRAVNSAPDADTRPTGPRRDDLAGWRSQRDLDQRVEREVRLPRPATISRRGNWPTPSTPGWHGTHTGRLWNGSLKSPIAAVTKSSASRIGWPRSRFRTSSPQPRSAGVSSTRSPQAEANTRPIRTRRRQRRAETSSAEVTWTNRIQPTSSTGDRLCPRVRQQADTGRRNPALAGRGHLVAYARHRRPT